MMGNTSLDGAQRPVGTLEFHATYPLSRTDRVFGQFRVKREAEIGCFLDVRISNNLTSDIHTIGDERELTVTYSAKATDPDTA